MLSDCPGWAYPVPAVTAPHRRMCTAWATVLASFSEWHTTGSGAPQSPDGYDACILLPQVVVMKTPVLRLETGVGLSELAGRAWGMLRDEGYLYLEGSQVEALPLGEIERVARAFFSEPREYKMRYYIGNSLIHRGYVPTGEEGDPDCEPDLKEGFDTGLYNLGTPIVSERRELSQAPWPDVDGFESIVGRYRAACEGLARDFATVLSCAFGVEPEHLNSRAKEPPNQLRLLRYPASPSRQTQGVGTHTDFECFTIMQVTGPGFSVQRPSGDWIDVSPRPNSVVVTVGDLIEVLTNGALRATPHRVGWVSHERYSFPYFFCLDADEIAEPLMPFRAGDGDVHYEPTHVGTHLASRTAAVFRYLRGAIS